MLRAYGPDSRGEVIDPNHQDIPATATWIDLEEPTAEEERLVELALGVNVPTPEELAEIEPSSRLYEDDGALYMTMSTLFGVTDGQPASTPIGFVLANNRLVTVRYATPRSILHFMALARRDPLVVGSGMTAMTRLLDSIVDRLADELEEGATELEKISQQIFGRGAHASEQRIPAQRLRALLNRIGRVQGLLAQIRETAVSAQRVIGFVSASPLARQSEEEVEKIRMLAADVASLIDHSGFLTNNLTFLLDASLGLISIEQNAIIKIFSVAAVIFLPPTLVGTVYGMNFDHMPELDWLYGYPMALSLMILSAILPYWFFKRRGWL